MEIHPGQGLLMLLFVDDGWVLSSPPWGPSKWELSITAQEAVTTSAIPILHLNWAERWRSKALFMALLLSYNIHFHLCLFSVLLNWQIIVLCHFLVPIPYWKRCLTSRDVSYIRRSIRLVQCPFWSFFFLISWLTLPCLISVTACPLYRICSLLHLKEIIFSY